MFILRLLFYIVFIFIRREVTSTDYFFLPCPSCFCGTPIFFDLLVLHTKIINSVCLRKLRRQMDIINAEVSMIRDIRDREIRIYTGITRYLEISNFFALLQISKP